MDRPVEPLPTPPRVAPWTVSLFGYAVALAITGGVLYYGMRLENVDLHVPFSYKHDALLILPLVKATVEGGDHWTNDRLGAPGRQELYDYPIVDSLHFTVIRLLSRRYPDPVYVYNLYYLLTYPLTTLTAMFALRRFRVSIPASIAMSVLYAFQPYHYLRGEEHYFLSAYYVIPLTLWIALRFCGGEIPFFRRADDGHFRFRPLQAAGWGTVIVAVLTATAGAYYAYFGCALLAAAIVYGWWVSRTWRTPLVGFGVVALIAAIGVANHIPTARYQEACGKNERPHLRLSEESEIYGMKIAQLVLPVNDHNWQRLSAIRAEYDAPRLRPCQTENEWDTIGMVASAGMIGLLIAAFLPGARRWPVGPLASLLLFAVLLGTIGGVGSLIGHLLTPQVRAYNRVSISIAFLALMGVGVAVDRLTDSRWRILYLARIAAFGGLLVLGLWDQLNNTWFRDDGQLKARAKIAEKFHDDREFFGRIEELFPEGGAVFNYPHVSYPESQPVGDVDSYDHVRGYLHTDRLRWSFGSMKGREWDMRLRQMSDESVPVMLERMVFVGFRGLLVDVRGLSANRFASLDALIRQHAGEGNAIVHRDGALVFYDLRAHAKFIEQSYGPTRFAAMAAGERDSLSALWLEGFFSFEATGREARRYHARPQATMVFVNPTERTRAVRIRMEFGTLQKDATTLTIRGGIWSDTIVDLKQIPVPYERVLVLPPGHHQVDFDCPPPASHLHSDSRRLFMVVTNFTMVEIPVP
jgi:hypothetical protein